MHMKNTILARLKLALLLSAFMHPSAAAEPTREGDSLLAATTKEERAKLFEGLDSERLSALEREMAQRANSLLPAGHPDEAWQAWTVSLELAERLQDKPVIVESLTELATVRARQGQFAEAERMFADAIQQAEAWGDQAGMAWAWSEQAFLSVWRGDFGKARELGLKSLPILEASGQRQRVAATLFHLGDATSRLGDPSGALEFYKRSLRAYKDIGDERSPARPLYGMGVAFEELGDYCRALDHYQKALAVAEANNDNMGIAAALSQIGSVFKEQGDYVQALEHEKKSLQLAEEMHLAPAIMNFLDHLGETYHLMKDSTHAMEVEERALALARQMGSKNHEARILNEMGRVASDQGDMERALELNRSSVKLAETLDEPLVLIGSLQSLGEGLLRAGHTDEALDTAEKASRRSKEVQAPSAYWQTRWLVARILRARGRNADARAALDEAIATIEELRAHSTGEGERGLYFETLAEPYYEAADLAQAAGETQRALSYAERAKARALLETLRNGRPNVDESLSDEERTTRQALLKSMQMLNRQIQDAAAPDAALRQARDKVRQEYAELESRLYAAHPGLRVQQADLAVLPPEEQSTLLPDPKAAMVEFVVLERRVLTFVITAAPGNDAHAPLISVSSREIPREELRQQVRGFVDALATRRIDYADRGRALYDLLIKPIESRIEGRLTLGIIPDDVLWRLPFQALQPDSHKYLIERHAVFYAPSLSALREMSRTEKVLPKSPTFLGVGNPALSASVAPRLQALYRDVHLGALPEADREVRTIGRIYGSAHSTVLTGARADEREVKRKLAGYDIVHLATHAILDDTSPLYSQIVLAPTRLDAEDDGLLEAWEIMRMKLNAELVVLSGCQTARGRVGRGEGVVGMSWAFLVAGCPTTVASQWNVESRSTEKLMVAFHRALASSAAGRVSKAEALRRAQLQLLRDPAYAHPFYWAAFGVIGAGF
jgi:CHAT domain-containing protein